MNRFEQLIEYVINDEEAKARELFHDIVVEKSRQIYEDIMAEEAQEELDEAEDIEEAEDMEEDLEEGMMGGDAQDDLIDEVDMEEESDMNMEAEDDKNMEGMHGYMEDDMDMKDMDMDSKDMGSEPATKDDIMNLEDKLDQLMAEFEDMMGSDDMGDGDDFGPAEGGDAIKMDDTEEMMPMAEAVSLKAAPKPTTSEEGSVNKKSTYAANSGQAGMASRPVHTGTDGGGHHDTAAYKNTTKDLIGKVGNTPAQSTQKPSAAPKPKMGAGSEEQNTKSPLPAGRKG
jgi:hypothetical protein